MPYSVTASPDNKNYYNLLPMHASNSKQLMDLKAEYPNKILVLEFFSYGCYWCSKLRKDTDSWKYANTNPNVVYLQVPVGGARPWQNLAKAYYTAQKLERLSDMDAKLFSAIHHKRINLANPKLLQKFFIENGVSPQKFAEVYYSPEINKEAIYADSLGVALHVAATPLLVVSGPYTSYMTDMALVGGKSELLIATLDELIAKENQTLVEINQ